MYGKEILNIQVVQGRKSINDKKILVENKPLSIRDLITLVKLMADNERRINRDKIARNNRFFFAEAIHEAVHTDKTVDDICKRYLIPNKGEDVSMLYEL